jgi:hypothetical protein
LQPKILHISFDYSNANVGKSTVVVADLINETRKYSVPKIISLKRTTNIFSEKSASISDDILEFHLFGFPYGLFLYSNMHRTKSVITKYINNNNPDFKNADIIHSHKLTFEGFVGYFLAKEFNKPLFISIRQTDFFVLKYRPDLKSFCKNILTYASTIFIIAPYMKGRLIKLFGDDFYNNIISQKLVYLPNPVNAINFYPSDNPAKKNFLTILWLNKKAIKRKNLYRLFLAIKSLNNPDIVLDVIGHGDYENKVKEWTAELDIEKQVNFIGFVKNDQVTKYLNNCKAFLLPSHSETFGVAYAEALLCGVPILYTKGTGFDGMFEEVGVSVNSKDVSSIAQGIKKLNEDHERISETIKSKLSDGIFNIFSRENIGKVYSDRIDEVLKK